MILPSLFAMACSAQVPTQQDACNKFMEASAKSTQVWQNEEKTENYLLNRSKTTSDNYLGKEFTNGIGGVVYSYRVFKSKAIVLRSLPTFGVCDNAFSTIGVDSYSLSLGWRIPW